MTTHNGTFSSVEGGGGGTGGGNRYEYIYGYTASIMIKEIRYGISNREDRLELDFLINLPERPIGRL